MHHHRLFPLPSSLFPRTLPPSKFTAQAHAHLDTFPPPHTGAAHPNDVPADESNALAIDNPDPQIPNPAVAKAAVLKTKLAHLKASMRGVPPVRPWG